ncbi:MAG: hypothetical protein WCT02_03130 [Candidatus Paceibacterota bacterium]|jgi:hypothetical protein
MENNSQKGSSVAILLVVVALLVVAGGYYIYMNSSTTPAPVVVNNAPVVNQVVATPVPAPVQTGDASLGFLTNMKSELKLTSEIKPATKTVTFPGVTKSMTVERKLNGFSMSGAASVTSTWKPFLSAKMGAALTWLTKGNMTGYQNNSVLCLVTSTTANTEVFCADLNQE